jgi:hypothetical protein
MAGILRELMMINIRIEALPLVPMRRLDLPLSEGW